VLVEKEKWRDGKEMVEMGLFTEDLILGRGVHFVWVCSEVCVGGLLVWVEWWLR
jgi:hypothetical protein